MKNKVQYIALDTLGGIFNQNPPASRGMFRQIIRVSPTTGAELCLYCGSTAIEGSGQDQYGSHMALMDHQSSLPRPQEWDPNDSQRAIAAAAREWTRAERFRKEAEDISKIEDLMSRRFACAILCGRCQTVSDQASARADESQDSMPARADGAPESARTAQAA